MGMTSEAPKEQLKETTLEAQTERMLDVLTEHLTATRKARTSERRCSNRRLATTRRTPFLLDKRSSSLIFPMTYRHSRTQRCRTAQSRTCHRRDGSSKRATRGDGRDDSSSLGRDVWTYSVIHPAVVARYINTKASLLERRHAEL